MTGSDPQDPSNGYEAVREDFIAHRTRANTGLATVRSWAKTLPPGGEILDLGCGAGVPITRMLVDLGFRPYGVDASPGMVAEFRTRCPGVPVEWAGVEDSSFFDRTFDGVIAWGLLFLLRRGQQVQLIRRMSEALKPGGRLLFTAPEQRCTWQDVLTGRVSVSLGAGEYRRLLEAEDLEEIHEAADEAGNHYFLARKPMNSLPG